MIRLNRPYINETVEKLLCCVNKELTQKEYDKIMSLTQSKKSGKIHKCKANIIYGGIDFSQVLEVCDGVLHISIYTRFGIRLITKILSFPIEINKEETFTEKVLYDCRDGREDKEFFGWDGIYETYCQRAEITLNVKITYNKVKANTYTDNFGHALNVGDEVYFMTGTYKYMQKGKITKLHSKKVTIASDANSYTIDYKQIAKV